MTMTEFATYWNETLAPLVEAPGVRVTENSAKTPAWKRRAEKWVSRSKEWGEELPQMIKEEFEQIDQFAKDGRWLTLDWILSPTNLQKLLDGNYRKRATTKPNRIVDSTREYLSKVESEAQEAVSKERAKEMAARILKGGSHGRL